MKAFFRLPPLVLTGLLLLPNPTGARCITSAERPDCEPLIGAKVIGLLTEVQEGAATLGVSERDLMETARKVIQRAIPQLQVAEVSTRAPQIHIVVARLRHEGNASSIHLQVEVRDIAIQAGHFSWSRIWVKNYVLPVLAESPVPGLMKILEESLHRLAADWRRAKKAENR